MAERTYLRGRVMRATRLDGCGNPVLGPDSKVISDGFVSIALTPNTAAGEAVQLDNAWGERKVDDTPTPKFSSWTEEYAFIGVNPDLLALMTGQPVELNADGTDVVGFRVNSKINVDLVGFAMEFWTGVYADACEDSDADQQWGYGLLPFNKGGTIGGITVQNGAINFTVTGSTSRNGSQWGVGPYDVVEDEDGLPGPLNSPVTSGDHLVMVTTSVAPPTATDGEPSALGVPATGATAGTPGTTTPANSYAPADFAALTAAPLTASPSSAWTTGQRIKLRDGSTAHWNGTAWVAGPA